MGTNDEIRKEAEDIWKEKYPYLNPDYLYHEREIDAMVHAITQDRARRDSLEDMLVELGNIARAYRLTKAAGGECYMRIWDEASPYEYTDIPTERSLIEAARAALDEMKGKGDA